MTPVSDDPVAEQSRRPAPVTAESSAAIPLYAHGAQGGLPPALEARRLRFGQGNNSLSAYISLPLSDSPAARQTPLLLIHSVNAAPSAAEVRPVFNAVAATRPVMALELPGFGSSARPEGPYTPERMTEALIQGVEQLRNLGHAGAVDLMAVSLSCEFAARAALAQPALFRSLALVSPTGLEHRKLETYEGGQSKDKPWLRSLLERGPWNQALFRGLTRKSSMRKFLERTWGSKEIDEKLLAYNVLSVRQPGARHAPYAFMAGALFTRGVAHLYERLRLPVWVAHGTRGEFASFDGLQSIQPEGVWSIDAFDAGAMPYFEQLEEFMACYRNFLGTLPASSHPAAWRPGLHAMQG